MNYKSLVLVLLCCQSVVRAEERSEVCLKSEVREVQSELSSSIRHLKNSVSTFFNITLPRFDPWRRKVKILFYNLIKTFSKKKCN